MYKVFVADDHDIVRHGLTCLIDHSPYFQLVGQASDSWNLVQSIIELDAELLVLDGNMPGPDVHELIQELRKQSPHLVILMFSMIDDVNFVARTLKAGAKGYITKNNEPATIIQAMTLCMKGSGYIQPELAAKLVNSDIENDEAMPHKRLTARELQIFMLLASGISVNEISQRINRSPKTVSTHKFRIMQKIAVQTNTELIRYAIKHQLINL